MRYMRDRATEDKRPGQPIGRQRTSGVSCERCSGVCNSRALWTDQLLLPTRSLGPDALAVRLGFGSGNHARFVLVLLVHGDERVVGLEGCIGS